MTTIRVMHAVDYLALSQPWYSDPMDMQQRHCLWCDDAFWTDAAQPQAACCDHCVDMLMEHSDEIPPQDWAAAFTDYLNTHEVVDKDSDTVYYQNHKVYQETMMDRQTANSLEAILHTLNDDNTQFVITETPDGACTLTLVIRNDSTISMVWINQALVICRDFDTTGGKQDGTQLLDYNSD